MISTDDLKNYSLFGGISDNLLAVIRELVLIEEYPVGEDIIGQGDHGDRVYFILEGRVQVFVDGIPVAELNEGQQFGEMHLVDIQVRSARIQAMTRVRTLSLSARDIMTVRKRSLEAYMLLLMNCARDISRRLRDMNHRYATLLKERDAAAVAQDEGATKTL